ncbi:ABC transporter permease subunit [Glaciimonas sp. CA11.2]|uniref:amino acid ABC transporter permease n=1 Tax=Glaciimonas sp. CA11.2 TaxID=3048601 RepID=UPI002AB50C4E|nr:ABC transporter permease subunit [Glaciimonas sp. CA11.2]MDY7547601.1 ABC transporter permease subunit [Glaciimonas sp. CA11.2]MEB0162461.1 ABC transporter permease subunit [Glaciimonas sp. CA11.2]
MKHTGNQRWRGGWRSKSTRSAIYQVIALAAVIAMATYLLHNTFTNMRARGVQSGFDFLSQPAGFSISETLLVFDSSDSYLRALMAGLLNTIRVAVLGCVLSTIAGTLIGIGRLSRNVLLRGLCGAYVEVVRNVPLLLQLFTLYFLLTELMPSIDAALHPIDGLFLSKNGLQFPLPKWDAGYWGVFVGALAAAVGCCAWRIYARRKREANGRRLPVLVPLILIVIICVGAGWMLGGAPHVMDVPRLTDGVIEGGAAVTPEFLTILIGLTIYNSAFIAEIVRGGIQSVPFGQHEAAAALGLGRIYELRFVQLPQAMRVIVPPLTSQYMNLTKNSSLAIAIGYPDLVSVANTTLNQTGRAFECISLVMGCYLTLSLVTAVGMNIYNKRSLIKER